jgi:hypothetical protein
VETLFHRLFEDVHAVGRAPFLEHCVQAGHFYVEGLFQYVVACFVLFLPFLVDLFLLQYHVHARSVEHVFQIDVHQEFQRCAVLLAVVHDLDSGGVFEEHFQECFRLSVKGLILEFVQ